MYSFGSSPVRSSSLPTNTGVPHVDVNVASFSSPPASPSDRFPFGDPSAAVPFTFGVPSSAPQWPAASYHGHLGQPKGNRLPLPLPTQHHGSHATLFDGSNQRDDDDREDGGSPLKRIRTRHQADANMVVVWPTQMINSDLKRQQEMTAAPLYQSDSLMTCADEDMTGMSMAMDDSEVEPNSATTLRDPAALEFGELLQTEKSYVDDLEVLADFLSVAISRPELNAASLPGCPRTAVSELLRIHRSLARDLERVCMDPVQTGRAIAVRLQSFVAGYGLYIPLIPILQQAVQNASQSPGFVEAASKAFDYVPPERKVAASDWLLKPFQRVTKYPQLLEVS